MKNKYKKIKTPNQIIQNQNELLEFIKREALTKTDDDVWDLELFREQYLLSQDNSPIHHSPAAK